MSSTKSRTGIKLKPYILTNFDGIDSSTDVTAQDSGENQPLNICNNAYCDWRGQIVRDPAAALAIQSGLVTHLRFYDNNDFETNVVYAEENGATITLKSDRDHSVEDAYQAGAIITSTVFDDKVHLCSRAGSMRNYDGSNFGTNESATIQILSPAYCCSVQRRLVVGGLLGKKTQVQLSRVDTDNVFPDDEDPNDTNVLRAGNIEIGNLIGTSDEIKGIASFEQNRLAIFTQSKTLIYLIDPDINNWAIDDRANINIGTISHNTIRQAGTDLIFCSDRGVHTIKRSAENGILVYADILSKKVDIIYRKLLNQVTDKESIYAIWDQETSQYHIYFPISQRISKRLTVTMNGEEDVANKWSTGDYINARCGDVLGGRVVISGYGGIYELGDVEDDDDDLAPVKMEVKTPVLWHGSMTEDKESHGMFLHVAGQGDLLVEIFNERDQLLTSYNLEIEDDGDGSFPDNPIVRQYDRKFESRYRGLRVKLTSQGKGLIRVIAIGFNVRV